MVTSVACFTYIVLYSSTKRECLCEISTKELLQCVFLIISNCLWNLAITTVTNRIVIPLTHVIFSSYLGMHADLLHHYMLDCTILI